MENMNVAYMEQDETKGNNPVSVAETVKPYTFRKLNSTDLFPMIKLITKIGIDELTDVFEGNTIKGIIERVTKNRKNTTEGEAVADSKGTIEGKEIIIGISVALKLVNKIMENIPSCENEIYALLSRVSGMDIEEIKRLDIDIFMEMLLDFVTKDEFRDFFRVASRYISRLG